jgi:hypothetical protein
VLRTKASSTVPLLALLAGCSRGAPDAPPARAATPPPVVAFDAEEKPDASDDVGDDVGGDVEVDAPPKAQVVSVDGPHTRWLEEGRPIYYAFPAQPTGSQGPGQAPHEPWRLVVNLHGTCGGPSYACGSWVHAGVEVGALVCPTGNAHCGPSPVSPPTWEAPSWPELVRDMDSDLERSIAIVSAHSPRGIRREGAILTGYSRGGYAVPVIAGMHPGRWPLLLIIEADATLDPAALRRARVRAVALVAGEWGDQIAGMRKSAEALLAAALPAKLFVMPKTGHLYSDNIEDVMRDALAFLAAADSEAGAPNE